ncbi:MAG: hypothetical protein U0804_18685 [Gemmataceae bacterium]
MDGFDIVTTVFPGTPTVQPMVEFNKRGARKQDNYCAGFDWRFFGLSNDGRCLYPGLQVGTSFPAFFRLPDLVTRSDRRDGVPCLVATWTKENLERSVWLSESVAFNPVFFMDRFEDKEKSETRTTEISWHRTPGGHLYPKSISHNSIITRGGGRYAFEEVTTISHADFASPIDPTVFTLAGLGLNEGQVIGLPGLKHEDCPVWHNGKLDPAYTVRDRDNERAKLLPVSTPSGPPAPYPTPSNAPWIVGVVAGVVAVVTGVAALVIRRRRAVA